MSGVGKTTFASTFPAPFFLDCEKGADWVANKDAYVCETTNFKALQEAMEMLQTNPPQDIKTVVLDSVTQVYEFTKDWWVERKRLLKKSDYAMISMEDYPHIKSRYGQILRDLIDLPYHIVLVGQSKSKWITAIENGSTQILGTELVADVQEKTVYYPEVSMELVLRNGKRFGIIGKKSDNDMFHKDRTRTLPNEIEEPDFKKLASCINAGVKVAPKKEISEIPQAEPNIVNDHGKWEIGVKAPI